MCAICFQDRVDIIFFQIAIGDIIAEHPLHEARDPVHAAMLLGIGGK